MSLTKPTDLSLQACIEYYLAVCRGKGQSERSVISKASALDLFKRWAQLFGTPSIDEIDEEILDNYQQYLLAFRKSVDGNPLSRGTIRYRLTAVKVMIGVLTKKGVLKANLVQHFELPKLGRRLPKPVLTEKEVNKVIGQTRYHGLKGIRDKAIMLTYYASGIRRFELQGLTLDDIDFEQYQLRVFQGKGFKDRYVPVSKEACFAIYHYQKQVRPKLENEHSGKVLFLANNGKPFRLGQLSELVAKYIKHADIRKTGACNQYRHAAATHMVDRGADIRHVQEFLGHADISTTQIYVHVSMAKLREVYNRTHPSAKGGPRQ
jgi:integrase/recombinase XerD